MQNLYITEDKNKQNVLKKLRKNKDTSSVLGIKEFIKKYDFSYQEEALFYLAKKYNITREIANIYINSIYLIRNKQTKTDKTKFLKSIKEELLENNLITENALFKDYLKNVNIILELSYIDNFRKNLIEELKHLTTVKIEEYTLPLRKVKYYEAETIEDEVIFVCNQVRKYLDENISIDQIYITNLNQDYRYYLNFYGEYFGLSFSFLESISIYGTIITKYFLDHLKEDWNVVFNDLKDQITNKEEETVCNALIEFCNQYVTYPKDDFFYEYIKDAIKNVTIKKEEYLETIKEIDFLEEQLPDNSYLFIMGTNETEFPIDIKDTDYLNDKEKKYLNLTETSKMNEIIKETYKNKILALENAILTYKKKNLSEDCYKASMLETLELEPVIYEETFTYSDLYNKLVYAKEMDNFLKTDNISLSLRKLYPTYNSINYRGYHNEYIPFKSIINKTLSFSAFDLYARCPFRFYLAYILKLREPLKKSTMLGTIIHEVLKEVYNPDFDLETVFEKTIEKYKPFTKKDEFYLKKAKDNLKGLIEVLKKEQTYTSLNNIECEVPISFLDKNGFKITGIIDKIMYNDELLCLIDYKTGNKTIDFTYFNEGIDIQLPIYLYLLNKSSWKDYKVGGFYLQKVIPALILKDSKMTKEEQIEKSYRLNGYSIDNEKYLSILDKTFANSKMIKGLKKGANGLYKSSKVFSESNLEMIIKETEEKIDNMEQEIEKNNFVIGPKNIGGVLKGCEFCPYEPICYKKEDDIVYLEQKECDILGGDNVGMDEGTTIGN